MLISDWSSDVCSSDLAPVVGGRTCRVRALLGGVAAVGELADVARAAVQAGDQHGGSPRLAAVPIDLVLRDAPQRPWAGLLTMRSILKWSLILRACESFDFGDSRHESKQALTTRSAERRVGKECVSTSRSGWSTYH